MKKLCIRRLAGLVPGPVVRDLFFNTTFLISEPRQIQGADVLSDSNSRNSWSAIIGRTELKPGDRLGALEIVSLLGKGGRGEV
jgi:hypothetical protein